MNEKKRKKQQQQANVTPLLDHQVGNSKTM